MILDRLKQARNNAGMTHPEVNNSFNKGQSFTLDIERGKVKLTADYLKAFCLLYKVSPSFVLGLDDIIYENNFKIYEAEDQRMLYKTSVIEEVVNTLSKHLMESGKTINELKRYVKIRN